MSCLFVRLWGAGALAARASVAHQAAANQLKHRHCWRLLRRKRLAGGNDKARQGLRAALLHHMAVQTNRLIPGQEFPLLAAFVFPLIEDDCEHTPSPISHSC